MLPKEREREYLEKMLRNRQIVLRYSKSDGEPAGMTYPFNPNGSVYDIAGICNPEGNVFGLMPHPERASEKILSPYHDQDGLLIFQSMVDFLKR